MDKFGVPKKINRQVLKAIYSMHEDGHFYPNIGDICEAVEVSMRNNVPVRNLHGVVGQSLRNMVQCGIIDKDGSVFFLRTMNITPSSSRHSSNCDSEIDNFDERDANSRTLSFGAKRSRKDSTFGPDYSGNPRKTQRLMLGVMPSNTEMNSEGIGEQGDEESENDEDQEEISSSHAVPREHPSDSQTPVMSESNSVKSKISDLPENKDQLKEQQDEQINGNSEDASTSAKKEKDTNEEEMKATTSEAEEKNSFDVV